MVRIASRLGYSYTPLLRAMCIIGSMRRVQIHLDEELDDAAKREATRRGISKAALVRASLAKELGKGPETSEADPWAAITGWFEDGGVDDIDAVVYGKKR